MDRKVPYGKSYELVNKLSQSLNIILWLSTVLAVIILIVNNIFPQNVYSFTLNVVLVILSITYFLIEIIQRHLFHNAELERKNDFIGNGLKLKLSEENSTGYFNNENLKKSIYKLGVNCFESSFFTKSVTKKIRTKYLIQSGIVLLLIITLIFIVTDNLLIQILLLALPYSIVNDTIKVYWLHKNTDIVFKQFTHIFTNVKKEKLDYLIIDNILNYEKSLSRAAIVPDSKVFNKMKKHLSEKWNNIKLNLEI